MKYCLTELMTFCFTELIMVIKYLLFNWTHKILLNLTEVVKYCFKVLKKYIDFLFPKEVLMVMD